MSIYGVTPVSMARSRIYNAVENHMKTPIDFRKCKKRRIGTLYEHG